MNDDERKEYEDLLKDKNKDQLVDKVKSRLKFAKDGKEKHKIFSKRHSDDSLKNESYEDFQNRVVGGIANLGKDGGKIGRAMLARILYGKDKEGEYKGLNIELSNSKKEGWGDNKAFSTGGKGIGLYSHSALFNRQYADVNGPYYQENGKPPSFKEKMLMNDNAWNPETMIGHELGHELVGIHEETINTLLIQNQIARSLNKSGKYNAIETNNYNSDSITPFSVVTQKGGLFTPRVIENIGHLNPTGRFNSRTQDEVPAKQWFKARDAGKKKLNAFLKEWK